MSGDETAAEELQAVVAEHLAQFVVGSELELTLPADWRDRIACAVHLLGCDAGLLRVALTDDDRIDLTDLRDHLDAVLAEPQEQTA